MVMSVIITLDKGIVDMPHINYVHSFDDFLQLSPDTKDMEFQTGKDDNHVWKLHVFLDQDNKTVSDPIIKDTAKFLMDNEVSFKMGNGGDGGKVFTIYIGEYDKAQFIAKQLNNQFGDRYKKDFPQGGVKFPEDMHVFNNIGMRFEGVKDNWYEQNKDSAFSYYGHAGVPSLNRNLIFNEINDTQLSSLACHIFLAEKCGAKYLGKDYEKNPWTNKLFEDLSTKYTYQEVQNYVSNALNYLKATHQERFIHSKNLVPRGEGVDLYINDIIPSFQQSNSLNNEISVDVKGLDIMPNANNITIYKNKFGNDIMEYKKDNKLLASCSLNADEHLIRLYADDGTFQEYITSPNGRTKQMRGDVLYPITNPSLECRIDNIASLSKVLGKCYLRAGNVRGIQSKTNQSKINKGR